MDESPFHRKNIFIIAEIGKNFIQTQEERPVAEYLENAKVLVRAAKESGADAVKFQTHNVEDEQLNINVVSPHFKGADRYSWVTRNMNATPLDEFWRPLKAYCDEIGIIFHSTPMSRGAAHMLQQLDVPFWKVGSGDILDFVMLDYLASTKKPIII
ncbi:MAG: N-acetylneuraminate synthase family protein, partial [Patescibacteria group bacterium]